MKKKSEWTIHFKYNMKLYWSLVKNYKFLFIGLFFLILLIEASQVVDKFLFKIVIDRGTEFVAGSLILGDFISILIIVAIVFISIFIFRAIGNWVQLHFMFKLTTNLIFDLKRKFFNHLIGLSHQFHTSNKTGSLISRLIRGGKAIDGMNDILTFNFAPMIFQLIVVFLSLIYFSWIPAVVVFATFVVFVIYSFVIQRMQQKYSVIENDTEDIEKANIADIFTNIDSIKYFGKERSIESKYKKLTLETQKAQLKHWGYWRWMDLGQGIILGIGTFLLIYFPILQLLRGEITIGTIVFIYTIYLNLIGPMFRFVHGIRQFYRVMADFESLFRYYKIENEIKDGSNILKVRDGEIEFKDMDFSFGKRKLFEDFDMKINKNQKVAFVGHSGSGKTTLIKLLYRMYDVDAGGIYIDGENIKNVKKENLRNEMSIVPQEAILFDDTIYNNVKFSNPKASREEIMDAMKFAQLDKIIEYFPKKERTIVGERGVKLSGGEKQRVSIARAILANKKILVLDEATSALDSQTEYEIQKDLERLMIGRTSIIIAHRLSTIMKADKIVVLDKGKIVQTGRHVDLIKKPGPYRILWNLQKGGYIK